MIRRPPPGPGWPPRTRPLQLRMIRQYNARTEEMLGGVQAVRGEAKLERYSPLLAQRLEEWRSAASGGAFTGERFRITGHCQSACTMFLAVRSVCIEPSARLLFHAGENDVATRRMLNSYNGKLRSYLTANKIMSTPAFTTIPGRDIIRRFGYRAC